MDQICWTCLAPSLQHLLAPGTWVSLVLGGLGDRLRVVGRGLPQHLPPCRHNLRFWNAAFFDAVHCERRKRSPTTR